METLLIPVDLKAHQDAGGRPAQLGITVEAPIEYSIAMQQLKQQAAKEYMNLSSLSNSSNNISTNNNNTTATSTQNQNVPCGLQITQIQEGSVIDKCGQFKIGDIIVEVNGFNLQKRTFQEAQKTLRDFVKDSSQQGPLILKVLRKATASSSTTTASSSSVPTSPRHVTGPSFTRRIGTKHKITLTKSRDGGFGIKIAERDYNVRNARPIYITAITTAGSAYRDGRLKEGDMLLEVNGIDLSGKSQPEVTRMLKSVPVDQEVEFTVSRDDSLADVTNNNSIDPETESVKSAITESSQPQFDQQVDNLLDVHSIDGPGTYVYDIPINDTKSAGLGLYLKYPMLEGKDLGIWIEKVITGGAAWKDGRLQPDDQILEINGISLVGLSNNEASETLTAATSRGIGPEAAPNIIRLNILRRDKSVVAKILQGTSSGNAAAVANGQQEIEVERFQRDGFGRQSISEKRHAQFLAQNSDTFRRNQKAREERELQKKLEQQFERQRLDDNPINIMEQQQQQHHQQSQLQPLNPFLKPPLAPTLVSNLPHSQPNLQQQQHRHSIHNGEIQLDDFTGSYKREVPVDVHMPNELSNVQPRSIPNNYIYGVTNGVNPLQHQHHHHQQQQQQQQHIRIPSNPHMQQQPMVIVPKAATLRVARNRKIDENIRATVDKSYDSSLNSFHSDNHRPKLNGHLVPHMPNSIPNSNSSTFNEERYLINSTHTSKTNSNGTNGTSTNNHKKSSSLLTKFLKFGSIKRVKKKLRDQQQLQQQPQQQEQTNPKHNSNSNNNSHNHNHNHANSHTNLHPSHQTPQVQPVNRGPSGLWVADSTPAQIAAPSIYGNHQTPNHQMYHSSPFIPMMNDPSHTNGFHPHHHPQQQQQNLPPVPMVHHLPQPPQTSMTAQQQYIFNNNQHLHHNHIHHHQPQPPTQTTNLLSQGPPASTSMTQLYSPYGTHHNTNNLAHYQQPPAQQPPAPQAASILNGPAVAQATTMTQHYLYNNNHQAHAHHLNNNNHHQQPQYIYYYDF